MYLFHFLLASNLEVSVIFLFQTNPAKNLSSVLLLTIAENVEAGIRNVVIFLALEIKFLWV